MELIEVRGVSKDFGPVRAVDDVSFTAPGGAVTAFLGPNGAGKTTTLRVLLGLARPTSGVALVKGRRYVEPEHPRRAVGAVLETSGAHPGRSGRAHLAVVARGAGISAARVEEVLEQVDLTAAADRRAGTYSLGMRQRLGLATALLGDPAVLILDEPANGLDPQGVAWLRSLLRSLAGEGRAVLVSSHLLAEVARSADRVVVLDRGSLTFEGPLADLAADGDLEGAYLRLMTPDSAPVAPTMDEVTR